MFLQAEASSKADQLKEAKQRLAEAVGAHQRQSIEAEARSKSEAADAVRQKSEELMQQKELLDRHVFTSLTVSMCTAVRVAVPRFVTPRPLVYCAICTLHGLVRIGGLERCEMAILEGPF